MSASSFAISAAAAFSAPTSLDQTLCATAPSAATAACDQVATSEMIEPMLIEMRCILLPPLRGSVAAILGGLGVENPSNDRQTRWLPRSLMIGECTRKRGTVRALKLPKFRC